MILTSWQDHPEPSSDVAVVVYLPGCDHECDGCHNPELQAFQPKVRPTASGISAALTKNRTDKLVVSGGDPLHPFNRTVTASILRLFGATVNICVYTGLDNPYFDIDISVPFYLKCGTYDNTLLVDRPGKHNDEFRLASSNQVLYYYDPDLGLVQLTENGVWKYDRGNPHRDTRHPQRVHPRPLRF